MNILKAVIKLYRQHIYLSFYRDVSKVVVENVDD